MIDMLPTESHKFKTNIIGAFLIIGFIFLAVYIGRIQLIDHDKYKKLAIAQHYKRIELPARRGSILDCNGNTLAESLQVGSIYADPAEISDVPETAYHLSRILKLKYTKVVRLLNKDKRFVWIKRKVSDAQAEAIGKLSLSGIYVKDEYQRFYPNGTLASHILGFTNIDDTGIEGIELMFDEVLSGKPGSKLIIRDALQRQIVTPDAEIELPRHGNHLLLTIDTNIQRIVEEELEAGCENHKPVSATAIVMDPMTGEILAMANYPTFDPNYFNKYPPGVMRNRAITDEYEPGSLIKPLVISGIFMENLASPDEVIFCNNGNYNIKGRNLSDSHGGYGNLTVSEVIVYSSNIGMAKLGLRMGMRRMYRYLKQFNFGQKTHIQLPGEIQGIFHPLKYWSQAYSLVSVSIGHEISVTPLQFITAFCSIPNGGVLLEPQIVKATISNDYEISNRYKFPRKIRRVMNAHVARDVLNPILTQVVKEGTGKNANLLEYTVAGKTGTSQKIGRDGRYSHEKYVGSFVAYAPAEQPRVCVLVMMNEPRRGSYYGGTVAAPIVREIIRRTLFYLGIEPSRVEIAKK